MTNLSSGPRRSVIIEVDLRNAIYGESQIWNSLFKGQGVSNFTEFVQKACHEFLVEGKDSFSSFLTTLRIDVDSFFDNMINCNVQIGNTVYNFGKDFYEIAAKNGFDLGKLKK
jgi:hypothetical protein